MEVKTHNFSVQKGATLKFIIKFTNLTAPIRNMSVHLATKWGNDASIVLGSEFIHKLNENEFIIFIDKYSLTKLKASDLVYAIHANYGDEIIIPFKGKIYIEGNVDE